VCDESTAHELINSFPQLDTKTAISFTQFYSWGVSKKSPVLLQTLNLWLTSFLKSDEYKRIYKKYYKD
ncbi:MAG: transporter substrate-binding domain-containing protein, partial [Eubacteriales bacterium]